jgi:hypothetical protein
VIAAGGGRVVRGGRTYELSAPRVIDGGAPEVAGLWAPARRYARLAEKQMVAELGERVGGFGPGRSRLNVPEPRP